LIPRPETEQIIEIAKSLSESPEKILDIGTGSGCISISLLSEFSEAKATLLDISSKALKIAHKNSAQHQTISRSKFLKSDLLNSIKTNTTFDLIVTNPPYIAVDEPTLVDPSTKKFEPSLALFSGIDGLNIYRDIFKQIEQKNIFFHYLIGEFGFGQKPSLELILKQYSNQYSYKFFNDLNNIPRIFLLTNKAWN
jgi:release factor glutamine methyltransferase